MGIATVFAVFFTVGFRYFLCDGLVELAYGRVIGVVGADIVTLNDELLSRVG